MVLEQRFYLDSRGPWPHTESMDAKTFSLCEVGTVGLNLADPMRARGYRDYLCTFIPGRGWYVAHVMDRRTIAYGLPDLGACMAAIDALYAKFGM